MNNMARREELRQMISSYKLDLICFQETKLACITPVIVRTSLGLDYADNFMYQPAEGTRGGILIAAKVSSFHLHDPVISNYSAIVDVTNLRHNVNWMFTGVYGPQGELEKTMFLRELKLLKQSAHLNWLIMGTLT
jgi:exonuclease III